MSIKNSFQKVKIKDKLCDKPKKSKILCDIDYDLAEKIRDYKYKTGLPISKIMDKLILIGLKKVENQDGVIEPRPDSVKQNQLKRNKGISESKKKA